MLLVTPFGAVGLEEAGTGEPVLWLHGYPLDRALWGPQLADPVPGYRFIAVDLPGFGDSDRIAPPSLDAWADWVVAVLDTLEVPHAVIGGLSMGGYLALALWRRHPGRVRALVLADTRAGPDTEEGKVKRRAMQEVARAAGAGAIAERMLEGLVGRTTRAVSPDAVTTLDLMMRRAEPDAIVDALQAMIDRPDSTPTLATISVPTLILCGDEDVLTPVAESRAMQRAIDGSRLEVIPEAGHVSNFERPAVFNRLLSDFLRVTIRTDPT